MAKKTSGSVEMISVNVTGDACSQSTTCRATVRVGSTMLRFVVKPDRSYYDQGSATIETWTPAGWTQVHFIPGACLASRERKAHGSKFGPSEFRADAAELLRVAFAVLAIAGEPSVEWLS
jgi:hypothetical protein